MLSSNEQLESTGAAERPPRNGLLRFAGFYALVGGLVSLAGWAADIQPLTDWIDSGISIQPNSALAAICAGAAVLGLASGRRRLATMLGFLVALLGASTLFQYFTVNHFEALNTALMFDRTWGRHSVVRPGLMGPAGATCWTLLGTALMLGCTRFGSRGRRVAVLLCLLPLAITVLAFAGYLYRVDTYHALPLLTVMALQTASFIGAIALAIVAAVPEHPPARWLIGQSAAAAVARAAVPVIVLVPLLLGWARLQGEGSGLYDARFGIALFATILITLLLSLLAWSVAVIAQHERAERRSEQRLSEELRAMTRLQLLSTRLVQSEDLHVLLREILAAAAELTGTDKGNIQFLDPATGHLRLVVTQGVSTRFVQHFAEDGCAETCGKAVQEGNRVLIDDILLVPGLQGTMDLEVLIGDGIRAIQSTPLSARDGRLLGMLNNHFSAPGRPAENQLRYLDLLARMAADLVERSQSEQALRDADLRKNHFLAILAHELRNPLAPMRTGVHLLRQAGGDAKQVGSTSAMIERQVDHMVRLVDDLLDVSRITLDKLELQRERVELGAIVGSAIEAVDAQLKRMGHRLEVALPSGPVWLHGDRTRLVQVVSNLLNNACKFMQPGGRIALSAGREGGLALVRVRDWGFGIAADQLPRIFDKFTQVDTSLERSVGGLGIGLSLVKRLVEMHGGSVEARSGGLDQGSEFVVRIPVLDGAPGEPEPALAPAALTARSCTILVADDNEDGADSLATLLQMFGHRTHVARDGQQAVEAAERERPDLVLLDIGMPRLNGYEACARIRGHEWGKDMLLVAVTGWGQESDHLRSKQAGFDAHLVKPITLEAVTEVLAAAPRRASVTRA